MLIARLLTDERTGVDLEDYKQNFVIMNLLELSQEQQRKVIEMQLQGNRFFEHLVNLAESRKDMDTRYRQAFPQEAVTLELEALQDSIIDADPSGEGSSQQDSEAASSQQDSEAEKRGLMRAKTSSWSRDLPGPLRRGRTRHLATESSVQSNYLSQLNARFPAVLFERLDAEAKALPAKYVLAHAEAAVDRIQQAVDAQFNQQSHEILVVLTMLVRQRLSAATSSTAKKGRRLPTQASLVWAQVVQETDPVFLNLEKHMASLMEVLPFESVSPSFRRRSSSARLGAAMGDSGMANAGRGVAFTFRDPVSLSIGLSANRPGAVALPKAWCVSVLLKCDTDEQCLSVLKKLMQGIDEEDTADGARLDLIRMENRFSPANQHPSHRRYAACFMRFTCGSDEMVIQVRVEMKVLHEHYEDSEYDAHYQFFWQRSLVRGNEIAVAQATFDEKFENLLVFLVEAIGVPVLLSLLLLTYSDVEAEIINIDELPADRLQLYKLGIVSGIKKRLLVSSSMNAEGSRGGASVPETNDVERGQPAAVEVRPKREKRKGALDQPGSIQASAVQADGPANTGNIILDLNSILRGKKVPVVTGEDQVAEAYGLVIQALGRMENSDMRTAVGQVVPKSHSLHHPVAALVEFVTTPMAHVYTSDIIFHETGTSMLRGIAVDNQEQGRREFTSRHVACALGSQPMELGLWTRLDMEPLGIALVATLAQQTLRAPAQYQFKHLSFQEGLYAEHLLLLVTSKAPPLGSGWAGWNSNRTAAAFLNNRYMNNTCRIAAGHLGALLAQQRPHWNFTEEPLTPNGRSALWFITDDNDKIESVNIARNDISSDDVAGLAKMITTCSSLQLLDISDNDLQKLTVAPSEWRQVCDALGANHSLTDLNLNHNKLGQVGCKMAARALRGCIALKRLGFSYNEPHAEPALAELFKTHPSLTSVELVEQFDRHLPSRAKDAIGRALLDNQARRLGFLSCDTFVLSEETQTITWPNEASISDAMLLAGALLTNTKREDLIDRTQCGMLHSPHHVSTRSSHHVTHIMSVSVSGTLTVHSFNLAPGATLASTARSALGEALLNNPNSCLAYCNDFGLQPSVSACEFDLSKLELRSVEPFRLLAGCIRGNRTLTHLKFTQLSFEHVSTLALALQGNQTLLKLELHNTTRTGGVSIINLPVPQLNGMAASAVDVKHVDLSSTVVDGHLGRVACEIIGSLVAVNTSVRSLDLSNTGVGVAIGSEGDHHFLWRSLCASKVAPLCELNLSNVGLDDKGGQKLLSSLQKGLQIRGSGYDKIVSLSLAQNNLGSATGSMLKEVLSGDSEAAAPLKFLDISFNKALEGLDVAKALQRNASLTAIDIRGIPGANTDEVYSMIGGILLLDSSPCCLGQLSCDVFRIAEHQTQLTLTAEAEVSTATEREKRVQLDVSRPKVALSRASFRLLAGVLKFNASLRELRAADSGMDNEAAAFLAAALRINKHLEQLDLRGNPIDVKGVAQLADSIIAHPTMLSVNVDGKALPIGQFRGDVGSGEEALDVSSWRLGPLAGHFIGSLSKENTALTTLALTSNAIGVEGTVAMINGLSNAPLKSIDISRSELGSSNDFKQVSLSICRSLGSLVELVMDENDLGANNVGNATTASDMLAPLCKVRSLKTWSMVKSGLRWLPRQIGTLHSLTTLTVSSNRLSELPESICMLASLAKLEASNNDIKALPATIGRLKSLQHLNISDNKIEKLPESICELPETLELLPGRNPLIRPTIEQARQGIDAIRRALGWTASTNPFDSEAPRGELGEWANGARAGRPSRQGNGAPSRHEWASAASAVVLFNCLGCAFKVLDGDVDSIHSATEVEITAAFNLQCVGYVRPQEKGASAGAFATRVEFLDEWLPWHSQSVDKAGAPTLVDKAGAPTLTAVLRWSTNGKQQAASLLVAPWLAYGCSIGTRLKTQDGQYCTVRELREDDTCEVRYDNSDAEEAVFDPLLETATRVARAEHKPGTKLMLLHGGRCLDAQVVKYAGLKHGSRHQLRVSGLPAVVELADRGAEKSSKALASAGGEDSFKSREPVLDVDLNESNHCKLSHFPSCSKYEEARGQYCTRVLEKHATLQDEATRQPLSVQYQHAFLSELTAAMTSSTAPPLMRPSMPPPGQWGRKMAGGVPSIVDQLLQPTEDRASVPAPVVLCVDSRGQTELLQHQMLHDLALKLSTDSPHLGPIRLMPMALSIDHTLVASVADDVRQAARSAIVKAFERDYPGQGSLLKQAIEMRALIIVVELLSSDLIDATGLQVKKVPAIHP